MMDLWIKAAGQATEQELGELLERYADKTMYCVAYFSGRFFAARGDSLPGVLQDAADLLELRVFDSTHELWAHRSTLGASFGWRVADDDILRQNAAELPDVFLQDAAHHCLDGEQFLDISEVGAVNAYGSRALRTTVGGHYALPIEEGQNAALTRSYLRYDAQTGAATAADWRMVGFGRVKEG
jgi:hypothetical protein